MLNSFRLRGDAPGGSAAFAVARAQLLSLSPLTAAVYYGAHRATNYCFNIDSRSDSYDRQSAFGQSVMVASGTHVKTCVYEAVGLYVNCQRYHTVGRLT